jgi:integrase
MITNLHNENLSIHLAPKDSTGARMLQNQQDRNARREPACLSGDRVNSMLTYLNGGDVDPTVLEVVTIVLNTGVRPGELCQMRWSDVDLEDRHMMVKSSKSGGLRKVPFGLKTLAVLQSRASRQSSEEFVLGASPARVFRKVTIALRRMPTSAGTHVTFQAIRNTFAARWFLFGGVPHAFQLITGIRVGSPIRSLLPRDGLYEVAAIFQERLEQLGW